MRRHPAIAALLLAVIALLGIHGSASAHLGAPAQFAHHAWDGSDDGVAPEVAAVGPALAAAPERPGLPWPAILLLLGAVAAARPRPRRAIALALVLVLAVFAFEDGLHSVHHGFDPAKTPTCTIAAAVQHLSATAVDHLAPAETDLPPAIMAVEGNPLDPASRFLCPDQGRGPPLRSV